VLQLDPGAQSGRVPGSGEELAAAQVEVALAGALLRQAQAAAQFELGFEEIGLQPVDVGWREGGGVGEDRFGGGSGDPAAAGQDLFVLCLEQPSPRRARRPVPGHDAGRV